MILKPRTWTDNGNFLTRENKKIKSIILNVGIRSKNTFTAKHSSEKFRKTLKQSIIQTPFPQETNQSTKKTSTGSRKELPTNQLIRHRDGSWNGILTRFSHITPPSKNKVDEPEEKIWNANKNWNRTLDTKEKSRNAGTWDMKGFQDRAPISEDKL